MKLPNHTMAVVSEAKLTEYLLSESHPEGKDKAFFFLAFGFQIDEWQILAAALLAHAMDNEVIRIVESLYGTRYVIEGILNSPDQRNPLVRSVWFIDEDSDIPRLVTAYPL
jgi:hypothetical protein